MNRALGAVYLNTALFVNTEVSAGASSYAVPMTREHENFAANDVIELYAFHNAAGSVNARGGTTRETILGVIEIPEW